MKRKLLIAGAALLLVAQTGITAFASGRNVFPAGNGQAGLVCHHYAGHSLHHWGRSSLRCVDGAFCAAGQNGGYCTRSEECVLHDGSCRTVYADGGNVGNGTNSGNAESTGNNVVPGNGNPGNSGDTWGTQEDGTEAFCAETLSCADGAGSCHVVDGACTGWVDADNDGFCDRCRYPVFQENVSRQQDTGAASQAYEGENPAVYGDGSGNYGAGYGNGCWDNGGSGTCDMGYSNDCWDNGSFGNCDPGYGNDCWDNSGSGNYDTGYGNGCWDNSSSGHHGSGHHGRGHHR